MRQANQYVHLQIIDKLSNNQTLEKVFYLVGILLGGPALYMALVIIFLVTPAPSKFFLMVVGRFRFMAYQPLKVI